MDLAKRCRRYAMDSCLFVSLSDQRARQFRQFQAQGLSRLWVVLTGWPPMGYDRQHPDEMPPARRGASCGAGALARCPTPWSGLAWFRTKAGRGRPARSRGTAPQELSRFGI